MKSNRKSRVITWPGPRRGVGELPPFAPGRQQIHGKSNRAGDCIEDSAAADPDSALFEAWCELMAGSGAKG
jgi:hypothetical protein